MPKSSIRKILSCTLALCASSAFAEAPPDDGTWHTRLTGDGRTVTAEARDEGYRLVGSAAGERVIRRQPASTQTASVLFDAMFALAQEELGAAGTASIQDRAFNKGAPIPCACLTTGAMWPYVWTRDLAYATDLGLFRFDPVRARNGLRFKLSGVRDEAQAKGKQEPASYVVQDTGSGGSWPVSTDRISWFLGARHLLDDEPFAAEVYKALAATLAQDRRYAFDRSRGLYRGETSFLDWREQSYPDWTAHGVTFIAESFALSTNVLYHEALELAATMAQSKDAAAAGRYREQAGALAAAIDREFWREDRGLYMSYIDGATSPRPLEAYDLLGTSLAIVSGVAPKLHARRALANYPTWEAGSPVIWPEREPIAVYHNRASWPFVSAYALKAARALDDPARIAHELRSILRNAALTGSNMENFELPVVPEKPAAPAGSDGSAADAANGDSVQQERPKKKGAPPKNSRNLPPSMGPAMQKSQPPGSLLAQLKGGEHKGPVINSPRQLWSIAAHLDLVVEGVFGLTDRGTVEPKLPRELVTMLFGDREEISLKLPDRQITLVKPANLQVEDNLLVAATTSGTPAAVRVQLRGTHVEAPALALGRPAFAPATPGSPAIERSGQQWHVHTATNAALELYVNNRHVGTFTTDTNVPYRPELQCISVTARSAAGIESLPSEPVCVGDVQSVSGDWPRHWTAAQDGHYQIRLNYLNRHGPINTGITAAVKMLSVNCAGSVVSAPVVMPHSEGKQQSTAVEFDARAGQRCTFSLGDGFNMSYLAHYANYTGGEGGKSGAVNAADIEDLNIVRQR